MTSMEHELWTEFLKMKPLTFKGNESEDASEFIINWYWKVHKMGIMKQHGIEFVIFYWRKILSYDGGNT